MSKKQKVETSLQIYVNEKFGEIRGLMIDGEPYFVGKDVAIALGYKDPKDALKKHVKDNHKTRGRQIATPSGNQKMTLIDEAGLYSLIMRSKLPAAEDFQEWVTSEVLPSIRKTGAYTTDKKYQKWLAMRQQSIETRKAETSTIKLFIEYAKSQGYEGDDRKIYSAVTIKTNLTAGLPMKNGRDGASISQLSIVDISENAYKQIFIHGMAEGLH